MSLSTVIYLGNSTRGVTKKQALQMSKNIELQGKAINALISRIEKIEKTIETYGRLIDRLETQLDKHEKNRYKHGAA